MSLPSNKNILFVFRSGLDYGQVNTGLDAALLAGAFDQDVSLLLIGDAVTLLYKRDSNPLQVRLAQLPNYGIKRIYIDAEALERFPMDLLLHPELLVPADAGKMKQLLHHTGHIVSF